MKYNIDDICDVLSEETIDNMYDNTILNEASLDDYPALKKISDSVTNTKFTKKIVDSKPAKYITTKADGLSKKYVDGMSKRSNIAAKLVKKPPADASSDIQKKYEDKVFRAKTAYKVGEIVATTTVAMGPFDLLTKYLLAKGMVNSDDPVDKAVLNKLNSLASTAEILQKKAKNFFTIKKTKPITSDDIKTINKMNISGLNIAKETDKIINKDDIKKESVDIENDNILNKFDELLLTEDYMLVDNALDILKVLVENTDYNQHDIFNAVEYYLEKI